MSAGVIDKSLDFAVRIVRLYQYLCQNKQAYTLAKQILKSGTSIGANLREAKYAQSRMDFISKNSIALKEAAETEYWLELLYMTDYIDGKQHESLKNDCSELIKMLTAIVKTTKQKE